MVKKWIFAAGAGLGYILGTRAGRERYNQMEAKARQVLDSPTVKEATGLVKTEATRLYDEGRQVVRDKVRSMRLRNGHDLEAAVASSPTYPATPGSGTYPSAPGSGASPMP
jgi:hypothetical protein